MCKSSTMAHARQRKGQSYPGLEFWLCRYCQVALGQVSCSYEVEIIIPNPHRADNPQWKQFIQSNPHSARPKVDKKCQQLLILCITVHSNSEVKWTHTPCLSAALSAGPGTTAFGNWNDDMSTKAFELLWSFHLEKKTTSLTVKLQEKG